MPINEELLDAFVSLVKNEADEKDIELGYLMGLDPTRDSKIEGPVHPKFYGGLAMSYLAEASEIELTRTEEVMINTDGRVRVYKDSPAFVLGAVLAGCKLKQDGAEVMPPLEASLSERPSTD